MIDNSPTSWFLVLFTFSILAIAAYLVRTYSIQYFDLKAKVHAIHVLIELIDVSLEDDKVSKKEFVSVVKRCLEILAKLF